MEIKEMIGFKVTTEITREKGSAIIESLVFFSEHESKAEPENNIWVDIHMGFKEAAFKNSVISFGYHGDLKDKEEMKKLAVELTNEYAPCMADELIDLLPDPEMVLEYDTIDILDDGGWGK